MPEKQLSRTQQWDRWVLHPLGSIPIFLSVMLGLFAFSMGMSHAFQGVFECLSDVQIPKGLFAFWRIGTAPEWLQAVLRGVGCGLQTTLSFIPVLMGLFIGLAVLEQSGYIARAARIAEGLTRWVRLPGKSFIPLLVGFGCNVPAVMGTRILKNARDRILTIMMQPFMSCGARLAIYAVFVSAFFVQHGVVIIFMLYLVGVLAAIFTVSVFQWALFGKWSQQSVLPEEAVALPDYQWPNVRAVLRQSTHRVKKFVIKAGILIIPFCVAMSLMGSLSTETSWSLEAVGKGLTPVFKPMGIKEENWPATVGLLAGVLAKEVVVGSLDALYSQAARPVQWSMGVSEGMSASTKKVMQQRFGSPAAAVAYLLFVLLYFPCISVVAAIAKELNLYWAGLSVAWSSGLAYAVSVIFYQSHRLVQYPVEAGGWIVAMLVLLAGMVAGVYGVGRLFVASEKQKPPRDPRAIAVKVLG